MPFPQSTPERNAEVGSLLDLLATCSIGATITWEALDAVLGRAVRPQNVDLLHRALAKLNDDRGILFANVRGIGYKRLDAASATSVGQLARRRIRKVAGTTVKRLSNFTTTANLTPDQGRRMNAELSSLGLIQHLSQDKSVAVQQADRVKPVAIVTRDFLEHIGAI